MTPPEHRSPDATEYEASATSEPLSVSDFQSRFEELQRQLAQLKMDVEKGLDRAVHSAKPSESEAEPAPSSSGTGQVQTLRDRELRRLKLELLQRKAELTEVRTESARSLQRVELENERLRADLAAMQRSLEEQGSEVRPSGFVTNDDNAGEPLQSSRRHRREAETMRPGAREGRRS